MVQEHPKQWLSQAAFVWQVIPPWGGGLPYKNDSIML